MTFWRDKVIFLTGASSGIGEGLAIELSKRGAILGLLARRESLLRDLVAKCERHGTAAREFPCDITDEIAVADAAQKLRNEFGKIDILIANAGIGGKPNNTKDLKPADFRRVIDTNLVGAVNSVSAVLPQMVESGSGQLVAISSLAGFRGLPNSAAYSASKAGMTAFFESTRLDVQDKGVAVTIIQPGFIKTPADFRKTGENAVFNGTRRFYSAVFAGNRKEKEIRGFPLAIGDISSRRTNLSRVAL